MTDSVQITQEVLRVENRYLTKIVAWSVASLISTFIFIGYWQVSVLNELVKKVDESTVSNNNRFNQLENRLNVGYERGSAIKDALENEHKLIWEAIKELKK